MPVNFAAAAGNATAAAATAAPGGPVAAGASAAAALIASLIGGAGDKSGKTQRRAEDSQRQLTAASTDAQSFAQRIANLDPNAPELGGYISFANAKLSNIDSPEDEGRLIREEGERILATVASRASSRDLANIQTQRDQAAYNERVLAARASEIETQMKIRLAEIEAGRDIGQRQLVVDQRNAEAALTAAQSGQVSPPFQLTTPMIIGIVAVAYFLLRRK